MLCFLTSIFCFLVFKVFANSSAKFNRLIQIKRKPSTKAIWFQLSGVLIIDNYYLIFSAEIQFTLFSNMVNSKFSVLQGQLTNLKHFKIVNLFKAVAVLEFNNQALIYEGGCRNKIIKRVYTYKELDDLSSRLANIINQIVIENCLYTKEHEDFIIGVHMIPSDYVIITLLAIWKTGASYLPLDPNYPQDRIEYILSDTKPVMIIYNEENRNFLNTYKLCINDFILSDKKINCMETVSINRKNDSAVILYTSGSTGISKGVSLSNTTILNRLTWQYANFPFHEHEKVCVFKTALTFVDSIFEIWGPLLKGRAVLVLPKQTIQNPAELIQCLEKHKIQRIVLVPSLLESILLYHEINDKKIILSDLNLWISSGEILTKNLVSKFYSCFQVDTNTLCNFYGSTEITDVTFYAITHPNQLDQYESFPLGTAVDNTEIYVVDSNETLLPEGAIGEIYSSGLNLPLKYLSKHNENKLISNEFSSNKIFSKLYKTGDLGKIEKGVLLFLGRTDSVIKIRGFRVDLIEIEKAINTIEKIKKAVVLCHKPGEMNQTILAFTETKAEISVEEIEDIVKTKLPSHMVPTVVCIAKIPLLINGKVDRQLLLKDYEKNKHLNGIEYTEVPDEQMHAAKILFETIASLGAGRLQSKISLKSNFFEVGGNSINSIFTINVLKQNKYHISVTDFIKSKNLQEVLNKLAQGSHNPELSQTEQSTDYFIEKMEKQHKDEVFAMVALNFFEKSNIETLIDGISVNDYCEFLEHIWPASLRDEISFVVKSKNRSIIAVSINHNADAYFDYTLKSKLSIIDDFFVYLEEPIKEEVLKKHKRICYSSLLAVKDTLTPQENVLVVHFIEQQIIKLARSKKYEGILTSNQSSLTVGIGNMYGYVSLLDCQVNQYVAKDNTKPFENAPDSQKVVIHFKKF